MVGSCFAIAKLEPYLPSLRLILLSAATERIADALNAANDANTVQFVAHSTLPARESYEAFIARTRRVPTRDNVHDLFNGMV